MSKSSKKASQSYLCQYGMTRMLVSHQQSINSLNNAIGKQDGHDLDD